MQFQQLLKCFQIRLLPTDRNFDFTTICSDYTPEVKAEQWENNSRTAMGAFIPIAGLRISWYDAH
jgi:hypothetical protein